MLLLVENYGIKLIYCSETDNKKYVVLSFDGDYLDEISCKNFNLIDHKLALEKFNYHVTNAMAERKALLDELFDRKS